MSNTGKLFIFNLKKIDGNPNISHADNSSILLKNSDNEIRILIETFEKFNADTQIVEETSKDKVIEKLTKIEKADFARYKYVAAAVLLHHKNENIAPQLLYFHNEIILAFLKNFTLKNKPKLFLIQACRNNFDIFDSTPMTGNREYFTPTKMIICYASRYNCSNYQDEYASRFIEKFCENLQNDGLNLSVQRIMKNTIRTIKEETDEKQIPSYLDHFHGDLMLSAFTI
ncbi:uncharacterized protein LOC129606204 [Condylostylus longicornis]|uniref:uncharacterized protein LOC129606204 n=1 Tax=Condylostylus longicornis TaxID=2530218 RepID=UPI00244E1153|nr:uncharacterized protein LOC129606204 [Condylostylus longicornis]